MKKIFRILLSLFMVMCLNQIHVVHAKDLDTVLSESGYELHKKKIVTWQTHNFDTFILEVEDIFLNGNTFSILFFQDGEYVDELKIGNVIEENFFIKFTYNDFITPTNMKKGNYNAYLVDDTDVYELNNILNDGKIAFDPNYNLNNLGQVVPIGTKVSSSLKSTSNLNITISQKEMDYLIDDISYYDVTIKSNDPNYAKSIKKIIISDYPEVHEINIKLNQNSYIDKNGNLVLYFSELLYLSPITFKVNIYADGYMTHDNSLYIDGRIFTPVKDIQLIPSEKGLEIISSSFNYINGLTKVDKDMIKTKGYVKFTKDGKTIEINNKEEGLADKVIKKSNGKYSVIISKDKLVRYGVDPNVKYNITLKPTCYEETNLKSSVVYKQSKVIPITSITLDKTNTTMFKDSTIQLNATINPKNTTEYKGLTWTSSNPDVAVVDEKGLVTSKAAGTAIIKVSTVKGKTATCTIKVIESNEIKRIYGDTRYQTAMKVADALKEELGVSKFETVIIATGVDYPDALAGSYLAGKKNAPILMVNERYMDDVANYVRNNVVEGGTVYILGGDKAVSPVLESKLSGYSIERLAGSNRFETNLLILEEAKVTNEDILICTGYDFADSLSASATERPILLVHPKSGLNAKQIEFLNNVRGNKMYVIGGVNAVNDNIYNTVESYAGTIKRIGGSDRNETSVLIAKEFFNAPTSAVVAYSRGFADGLVGGPLAIAKKAPLILTQPNKTSYASSYMTTNNIKTGNVLGGSKLVPDENVVEIFDLNNIK